MAALRLLKSAPPSFNSCLEELAEPSKKLELCRTLPAE